MKDSKDLTFLKSVALPVSNERELVKRKKLTYREEFHGIWFSDRDRTYLSGKWHLGKVQGTYPWDRGFDHYRGLLGGAADYYKPMPDRPFGEDGKLLRPEDLPEDFVCPVCGAAKDQFSEA